MLRSVSEAVGENQEWKKKSMKASLARPRPLECLVPRPSASSSLGFGSSSSSLYGDGVEAGAN